MKTLVKDLEVFDLQEVNGGKIEKTQYGESLVSTDLSITINNKKLLSLEKSKAIKIINDCGLIKDNKFVLPKGTNLIDTIQYGGCMEYVMQCGDNIVQTGLDIKDDEYFI